MDKKICIDTDACIAIINKKGLYHNLLTKLLYSRVFISTITLFELFLRTTNIEPVENFIKDLEILDFDSTSARKASEIKKELQSAGKEIEIRDLFIASTAIINNCTLATLNIKDFKNIKDLKLLEF
ncbi:type II toxin-antitoxin system VapC family toxin [Candidatus Woesearchaeota archaeon]|nr:type II toxin-antitoxin system VapC family toxin [Candidatus Woesearchaeota archaeon]